MANNTVKGLIFALPLLGSVVGGVIWLENRYQQVDVSVCQLQKSALDLEIASNEIRLEFYNKELLDLTSGTVDTTAEYRIKKLDASTLDISARLRVIKTELKAKPC